MFPTRMIRDDSLSIDEGGFSFDLRMPWYRALPVSSFAEIALDVDGISIDPARITIDVAGHATRFDDLARRIDDWWYVLDPARCIVEHVGGLSGGAHQLRATLGLRIPYIVYGDRALVIRESCTKSLSAAAQEAAA